MVTSQENLLKALCVEQNCSIFFYGKINYNLLLSIKADRTAYD